MITCDAVRLVWARTDSAVWLPLALIDDGAFGFPAVMHPARTASIVNATAILIIARLRLLLDKTLGLIPILASCS